MSRSEISAIFGKITVFQPIEISMDSSRPNINPKRSLEEPDSFNQSG
jgi:hypothetical protein